jgi:hypothetical protein
MTQAARAELILHSMITMLQLEFPGHRAGHAFCISCQLCLHNQSAV